MMKPKLFTALLFALMCCANAQEQASFAAHASIGNTAKSPDGKNVVSLRPSGDNADHFPTEVKVRTGRATLTSSIDFGLNPEILWSRDSQAFSITGSSDGAIGLYHTDVFLITPDQLIRVPLTALIEREFGHPVTCGWPEPPNVAAVKWLDGSRTLLLAAEIVPHSNCDSMGTFQGYVVDVQKRRIIRSYDQITVKRLFGADLGVELKSADDSCIRNPKSCFISANHPDFANAEQ